MVLVFSEFFNRLTGSHRILVIKLFFFLFDEKYQTNIEDVYNIFQSIITFNFDKILS